MCQQSCYTFWLPVSRLRPLPCGLLAHPSQFLHFVRHLPVASSLICIINRRLTLRLMLWCQRPLAVNRATALVLQGCCPHGGGGGPGTSVQIFLTPVPDCHKTVYRLVTINLPCQAGSYATLHNVIIGTAIGGLRKWTDNRTLCKSPAGIHITCPLGLIFFLSIEKKKRLSWSVEKFFEWFKKELPQKVEG